MGQELGLDAGHVDVGGTLGLAGFALQAQIHHFVETPAGESVLPELSTHGQPQGIGPSSCRMFLIARRHVGRAHGADQRLATVSNTRAHLDGPVKTHVFAETKMSFGNRCLIVRMNPQIRPNVMRLDDFPRIHHTQGIEDLFDLPKGLVKLVSEELTVLEAANQSIPVFTAPEPAVFHDQLKGPFGDLLHDLDVFSLL